MPELARFLPENPLLRALLVVFGSILLGILVELVVHRSLARLAAKTATKIDDQIVVVLRVPLFLSAILSGLYLGISEAGERMPRGLRLVLLGTMTTVLILLWSRALMRIGSVTFRALGTHARPGAFIQPTSLPLFDIGFKVVVTVGAVYFMFLAWHMDLTAWAASAGVIGVAVGFAAKDSLANLFAGIFILADAPYKVGDFIVLEGGLRGKVTAIGMRSTRILTLDHVEITVPNGIIASSRIMNEAGGPNTAQRLAVKVSAAYGVDVDRVREVLLACTEGVTGLCTEPHPEVRFVEFGDSGLNFQLLAWVPEPAMRDPILSVLNIRVYKAFAAAGIEIPYPKRDLYVKELPRAT